MASTPSLLTRALSVSELTQKIKRLLEGQVGAVSVEGELSNVKAQSMGGHLYFTLKDARAQLPCAWFKNSQRGSEVAIKDGMLVQVDGDIQVYEPHGKYQLIVRRVTAAGQGALQKQFEELKAKLQKEGLFEATRKRPLPLLPQHIGLVTSPTGAVIRDMLNVFNRRFPNLHFILTPVRVQGAGAADEIAAGLDLLNQQGVAEVIIVARGGGSMEDLWSFNEEVVARAIARSRIPVISAVGHETDFTISDFVADLRAPTPSAAAELAVNSKDAFEQQLDEHARALITTMRQQLLALRHQLLVCSSHPVFQEPRQALAGYRERVNACRTQLPTLLQSAATERRHALSLMASNLAHHAATSTLHTRSELSLLRQTLKSGLQRQITKQRQALHSQVVQHAALSPFGVLKRGYSLTTLPDGRVVQSPRDLKPGQTVRTRLADGTFQSTVTTVEDAPEKKSS